MRPAMEELTRLYERETGRRVEIDYGDSGSAMIKAEATGRGDLMIVHDPFSGALNRKGLSLETWTVAIVRPTIAVAKGNPKGIAGLKDLARPGVRVVLTDAAYSTAGHINAVMFKRAGIEEAVEKNIVTRTKMGGEAANAVQMGHADAAIVWNAVIHLRREKLDAVPIEAAFSPDPKIHAVTTATFGRIDMSRVRVTADLLKCSKQPAAARALGAFLASPRAAEVWKSFGFEPADQAGASAAAASSAAPLLVYAGAGLRPALEDAARAFTTKTGVTVECDYGGSGMIISRLRLSNRGDLFMPGDLWYVELAEKDGLVASKEMVCWFVPVIMVQKGNPKGVAGLKDLAKAGLRVGLGSPDACQVGRLSDDLLKKNAAALDADAIRANVVSRTVTVNELGLQVAAGALDAAIVWDAVAAQYADKADMVAISPAENIVSRVAIAVLKASKQPPAAQQFVDFLKGDDGRAIFNRHQYRTEPPAE
jgi:molybdate transport system substrate-binding protein